MNRDAWFIFFILCAILGAGVSGCVALEKHRQLERAQADLAEVRHSLEEHGSRLVEAWRGAEEARARARSLEEELAGVREELRAARVDLDVARLAVTDATRSQKALEEEMRAVLESRDVDISELRGELTVSILDRILFDSGDARLKPEGMEVLDKVASVLARYTNRPVQVFGHTDNVPIRVRYGSNWELSAARAVSAVRYLTEKAGVDPRRLSAVACGEHQPIADNSTAEGRALNRRQRAPRLP